MKERTFLMFRSFQPLRLVAAAFVLVGGVMPLASRAQENGGDISVPSGSHFPANPMQPYASNDPTRSAAMSLLYRADVQSTLALTPEQKAALVTLREKLRREHRQKMMDRIQEFMKLPMAERRKKMLSMSGEPVSLFSLPSGPLDKRTENIVSPEQRQRLHELDLRWRGPLALGEPETAEAVGLTPAQREEVGAAIKEYRAALDKVGELYRSVMMPQTSSAPKRGADPRKQKFAPSPEQWAAKRDAAQQKAEQTRLTSAEKVLALLTPAQKQQWAKLQGAPFTFQANERQ